MLVVTPDERVVVFAAARRCLAVAGVLDKISVDVGARSGTSLTVAAEGVVIARRNDPGQDPVTANLRERGAARVARARGLSRSGVVKRRLGDRDDGNVYDALDAPTQLRGRVAQAKAHETETLSHPGRVE